MEDNILIAESMGMYEEDKNLILPLGNDEYYIDLSDEDTFKFDSDWNWLMAVVEKIESLGFIFKSYGNSTTFLKRGADYNSYIWNDEFRGDNKMQSYHITCVEFFKWYNENKES